jgi:hypothetical protein
MGSPRTRAESTRDQAQGIAVVAVPGKSVTLVMRTQKLHAFPPGGTGKNDVRSCHSHLRALNCRGRMRIQARKTIMGNECHAELAWICSPSDLDSYFLMKILSTNRRLLIIFKINLKQTPKTTTRIPFPNAATWMDKPA